MLRKQTTIILSAVIFILTSAVILLSEDLREKTNQIEEIEKKIGYHDIRISGQLDTIMSHNAKIRGIVVYLNKLYDKGLTVPIAHK